VIRFNLLSVFILVLTCLSFFDPTENKFTSYDIQLSGPDSIQMQSIPGSAHEGVDSFWMSAHEITWDLYEHFLFRDIDYAPLNQEFGPLSMDIDAISSATTPYVDMSFGMGKDGYPVINVTQYAASTFCRWLTAKTGHFYRLPTDDEWEFACRAGSESKYCFGNSARELKEYAWFTNNANQKYQPVGLKKPNRYGLYDMHGNVAEWVVDDPTKPNKQKLPLYPRTVRGGSWKDDSKSLTCSARTLSSKEWKKHDPQLPKSLWWHTDAPFVGFRIVRPYQAPENYEDWWVKPIKDFGF